MFIFDTALEATKNSNKYESRNLAEDASEINLRTILSDLLQNYENTRKIKLLSVPRAGNDREIDFVVADDTAVLGGVS